MELDDAFFARLREQYLTAEFPLAHRLVWIAAALFLFLYVVRLVRRRVLREEYTPIWFVVSLGLALAGLRYEWLVGLTRAIGAWDPTSVAYFLGELFLLGICLNYAVRLSRYGLQIKNLGQELAVLRARLEELAAERAPRAGAAE